ncbi:GSCOCG00002706001-RA-CDS, partial [Cotesia congregata]
YLLLVRSIHTLLKRTITESEILRSEYDLLKFVGEFQSIYGLGAMTFNIHSLLYLGESVRRSGPLWETSAFPFENG